MFLIASFTMLLTCTPINPLIENLFVRTYFYFWSSAVRISSFYDNFLKSFLFVRMFWNLFFYDHLWEFIFLSLYENKQACECRRLKQIFYHQNTVMVICWFHMYQVCFFSLNSFHFVSENFFIIKLSLNSLNSVAIFTHFGVLGFLQSSESIEHIFGFNPTNLLIGIPLFSTFILPTIILFWLS